jgi:Uma2 family endonuclease
MSHPAKRLLTPEEYLAIERQADSRSEYFAGEMFAMVGASRTHNRIVTNLVINLGNQLRSGPCNIYSTDLRVRVPETGLYTYPDVIVTCGEEQFDDDFQDVLLNPILVIEVLSTSTEAYDRGKKFEHYQTIESLAEYVLVTQERPRVEKYVRQKDGQWPYSEFRLRSDSVDLVSIDCRLALEDIYLKVA